MKPDPRIYSGWEPIWKGFYGLDDVLLGFLMGALMC